MIARAALRPLQESYFWEVLFETHGVNRSGDLCKWPKGSIHPHHPLCAMKRNASKNMRPRNCSRVPGLTPGRRPCSTPRPSSLPRTKQIECISVRQSRKRQTVHVHVQAGSRTLPPSTLILLRPRFSCQTDSFRTTGSRTVSLWPSTPDFPEMWASRFSKARLDLSE